MTQMSRSGTQRWQLLFQVPVVCDRWRCPFSFTLIFKEKKVISHSPSHFQREKSNVVEAHVAVLILHGSATFHHNTEGGGVIFDFNRPATSTSPSVTNAPRGATNKVTTWYMASERLPPWPYWYMHNANPICKESLSKNSEFYQLFIQKELLSMWAS